MTLNFALTYLYSNKGMPKVETTVITLQFCTNNITAKKIGHFKKQNRFSSSSSLSQRRVSLLIPCFRENNLQFIFKDRSQHLTRRTINI